jgi:hypothetical protein
MQKRKPGGFPFCQLLCRPEARELHVCFGADSAPQKRCVQLCSSSKPGGVMSPPELSELSPSLYARATQIASEETENLRIPQMLLNEMEIAAT